MPDGIFSLHIQQLEENLSYHWSDYVFNTYIGAVHYYNFHIEIDCSVSDRMVVLLMYFHIVNNKNIVDDSNDLGRFAWDRVA